MITFFGKSISLFLCRKNIIAKEEIDIYQYGFEAILSTVLGFIITLLIGLAFNMILLSVIYYGIFVTVRQLTGGYHATSYLKCNILFSLVTFFVLGMTRLICISQMYSLVFHMLLLIISAICIWRFSPVENPSKPLTYKQKDRNHKVAMIILSALCILSSALCAMKRLYTAHQDHRSNDHAHSAFHHAFVNCEQL